MRSSGIVRKQLGLTFLGETREADKLMIIDVELQGLGNEVGSSVFGSLSMLT